ncbi:RES family NAD+ phosphorylase [Ferrovum sp.]|uniref:RES family NAD+ phosphorylase n=1 Tax=Ferrovum sp. TaxID=2609467 RepID=UPI002609F105
MASTMKLADNMDEQDLLELLLESSKPPQPTATRRLHYLLSTPFRYAPPAGGSRFRAQNDPGVFYGAQSVRTACAELGYRRWKFLTDAVDLERLEPVAHTAFQVGIATQTVDLRSPPFAAREEIWRQPHDYSGTQAFAKLAREAGVGAILYRSVRDPDPSWCIALLNPDGFATDQPNPVTEKWWIAVHRQTVLWRGNQGSMVFDTAYWR